MPPHPGQPQAPVLVQHQYVAPRCIPKIILPKCKIILQSVRFILQSATHFLSCRMFGSSPINMECPNCRAQVTTGKLQWKTDHFVCLFIFSHLLFGNKQLQTDHYHQIAEMFKTTLSISSNCWGHWQYCLGRSWSHVCSWWVISSSYCIITQFPSPIVFWQNRLFVPISFIFYTSGLWCCMCIPLCMDSLKVTPNSSLKTRALFFCTFWHQQLFWVATLVSMGTILGRAIFIRGDVSGKCVKCQFQFSYVLGESCNLRNSHNSCIFDVRACPDDLVPLWSSMENIFRMWLTSVQVAAQSLAGTKKHRKTPDITIWNSIVFKFLSFCIDTNLATGWRVD